jgi:hypothetical protein
MKKEVADKWVEALRSGKYKQGNGVLKDDNNKFCCLGVLCDISDMSIWIKSIEGSSEFNNYFENSMYLPVKIRQWAEMNSASGIYDDWEPSLASENDNGLSFNEIADLIEKHWKVL